MAGIKVLSFLFLLSVSSAFLLAVEARDFPQTKDVNNKQPTFFWLRPRIPPFSFPRFPWIRYPFPDDLQPPPSTMSTTSHKVSSTPPDAKTPPPPSLSSQASRSPSLPAASTAPTPTPKAPSPPAPSAPKPSPSPPSPTPAPPKASLLRSTPPRQGEEPPVDRSKD